MAEAQQPPDRDAADPVPQLAQLALDPNIAPGRVLDREPSDQIGELAVHTRPAAARVGPLPGDQPSMPGRTVAGVTSRQTFNCLGSSRINAARTAR